jgi:hypothetical protein
LAQVFELLFAMLLPEGGLLLLIVLPIVFGALVLLPHSRKLQAGRLRSACHQSASPACPFSFVISE